MKRNRFMGKGKWWVSPFNDIAEVYKATEVDAKAVEVQDVTFCDWGNSYGARYRVEDILQLIELLTDVGVRRFDVGAPNDSIRGEDIRQIRSAYPDASFDMRVKASRGAIDAAADCGVSGVVLEAPLGYPRLRYQLGIDWEESLEKCVEAISYAKEQGLGVTLAPFDLTRAQPSAFEGFLKGIADASALPDFFRIDDYTGSALPQAVQFLVGRSQRLLKGVPVQICASNDFGLALASALFALMSGAVCACASINGFGRRAGVTALDELLVTLETMLGAGGRYKLDKLFDLGIFAEQITGIDTPATKPFVGMRAYFVGENELSGATSHPLHAFGVNPRLLGRNPQPLSMKDAT